MDNLEKVLQPYYFGRNFFPIPIIKSSNISNKLNFSVSFMDDNIINIKRKNASLNLFELESIILNAKPYLEKTKNIKLLNYQELFEHIKTSVVFNGKYFEYNYVNNGYNVTLYMRSIKSIADYLFRYFNDTNIYCKKDKESKLDQKID